MKRKINRGLFVGCDGSPYILATRLLENTLSSVFVWKRRTSNPSWTIWQHSHATWSWAYWNKYVERSF